MKNKLKMFGLSLFLFTLLMLSNVLADNLIVPVYEDAYFYHPNAYPARCSETTLRSRTYQSWICMKFNVSQIKDYKISRIDLIYETNTQQLTYQAQTEQIWAVPPSWWTESPCSVPVYPVNSFQRIMDNINYPLGVSWTNVTDEVTNLRDYIFEDGGIISFCTQPSYGVAGDSNWYISAKESGKGAKLNITYTPEKRTVVKIFDTKDAHIHNGYPNNNYADNGWVYLANVNGGTKIYALYGYEPDAFAPYLNRENYKVKSAILHYKGNTRWNVNHYLYEVLQNWNEYTLTWNNQPTYNATYFAYQNPNLFYGQDFNITNQFQQFWESEDEFYDFIVIPTSGKGEYDAGQVRFSEWITSSWWYVSWIDVEFEPLEIEESYVNTSFESPAYTPAEQYDDFSGTSNNYNIEEQQTASIDINVTGNQPALNVTYDNQNALVIYRDSKGFSQNITDLIPYTKTYNLTDENITVYFDITPLDEDWNGFDASVVWDNHTDDYSQHTPNITVGYRKPIFNVTVNYSSPHYMEEDNDVEVKFIPNYQYAKVNASIVTTLTGGVAIPSSKSITDLDAYQEETIKINPSYLNYTQFTSAVSYDSKTQSNNKNFVGSVEKTYRYPLYNLTITYPAIMYLLENSTIKAKLLPNAFYQHAKANVTLKYHNQDSKVYFYDDVDQLTPIEVSVPYEKTYTDTYDEINGYFIVTPLTEDYTGYVIEAESVNPIQEISYDINKSEKFPPEDPDYIEVRYRYAPITYPLENKTLILQFHHKTGNLFECSFNETLNDTICLPINMTITCRTCDSNSSKQLVQYWTNISSDMGENVTNGCVWFKETLQGIKYWEYYPISMILQDASMCNNYTIVPEIFGFSYRGGIKSMNNRDKYVFYNLSRNDQNDAIIEFADAIDVSVKFDGTKDNTTVTDKNAQNMANTQDVYIATYKIENYKMTFYIANKNKKTIWADVIAIRNLNTVLPTGALYTTNSGRKISIYPVYDDVTKLIYIYPTNSKDKIPIEPATGSNSLELIYGEFSETLADLGHGIGGIFTGLGTPLAIFIILLAVGSGIGFILASVGRRVGAKI